MTAPTSSTNAATPSESPSSSEYVEMQGNSSPWTELFQADSSAKTRNNAQRQSAVAAAATATAMATGNKSQPQQQQRRSERPESDQRATQDALSAIFHQD
ncbi:MAG: hypothetical protein KF726_07805 [Anaerolineae bacterium]|nr:hypothetical protein [Anaerolineae bacterium]